VAVVVVVCVAADRTTRANVGVEGGDTDKGVDAAEALVRADELHSREGRRLIDESLARGSAEGRLADKGVADDRLGSDCVRRRLLCGTDCTRALSYGMSHATIWSSEGTGNRTRCNERLMPPAATGCGSRNGGLKSPLVLTLSLLNWLTYFPVESLSEGRNGVPSVQIHETN
jgi:hypothetical protein